MIKIKKSPTADTRTCDVSKVSMENAIHWHFGPNDAQQVIGRYLSQINTQPEGEGE